jgi:hypothetical protein
MSENTTAIGIGIVAIITAVGTAGAMLCKVIKKSDCMGLHIETRTPPPTLSMPPSPIIVQKQINSITNETVV